MIVTREIRWNPFFAGLSQEQIEAVAEAAQEFTAPKGHVFFEEGEILTMFYLVKEGTVDITIQVPDRNEKHLFADQLKRNLKTVPVTASIVREGEMFGWSAIVEPHESTAGARVSSESCTVIAVDCLALRPLFAKDLGFANQMLLKAAQTIRIRLRDKHVEIMSIGTE